MSAQQPEEVHPATQELALLLNDIRTGAVKGRPRELAAQVIDLVFRGEAERWDGQISQYEGGDAFGSRGGVTEIEQNGSNIEGSHRRKILIFLGPWEEGSPEEKNADPLTGEVPNPNPRVKPAPSTRAPEDPSRGLFDVRVDQRRGPTRKELKDLFLDAVDAANTEANPVRVFTTPNSGSDQEVIDQARRDYEVYARGQEASRIRRRGIG